MAARLVCQEVGPARAGNHHLVRRVERRIILERAIALGAAVTLAADHAGPFRSDVLRADDIFAVAARGNMLGTGTMTGLTTDVEFLGHALDRVHLAVSVGNAFGSE